MKEKPYAGSSNLHYDKAAGASVWKIASVETGLSNDIVKLSIKPASADTYLKFDGTSNNADVQYLYLQNWSGNTFTKEAQNHENISGESVAYTEITSSDNVWVVGNSATPTSYWNGEVSRFVTYSKGHGYAFYTAEDASREYQALLNEAKVDFNAAYTTGHNYYSEIKPVTLSDAAPVTLTADGNLFCNAEQTKTGTDDSGMTLSNLVDNRDNTSFHSSWQDNVAAAPSTWHYLQVNLAEATSFIDFTYRTRHDKGPYPTIIEIQCSSDNVNYVSVATFTKDADGLPQANATSFSSRVLVLPFASKYIRYVVKGNSSGGTFNGYPYFALSAFGLNTYTISNTSASTDPYDYEFNSAYYNLLATAATINEADNSTLLLSDVTPITEQLTALNNKYGVYASTKDLDFITVDPASPKYFAIKSGRTSQNVGDYWMWTLKSCEGGKIKIESMADATAVSNNVFTYWSMVRDEATGFLKLIPYIEPSLPMGYTTVGDGENKLTNISTTSGYVSNLYEYVPSGNTDYPYALKPAGGSTYVSNHTGTDSYMGFYNVLDDAGTYFAVVSQNPITHIENLRTLNTALKNSGIGALKESNFGTGLNQVQQSCKSGYDDFFSAVNSPLATQALTELTDDQLTTLTTRISNNPPTLEMNQPATGKFYRFKSVKHSDKRLRSDKSGNTLKCGDVNDNGRESIFYLTADNKLVAYVEGQYIGWNKDALADVGHAGYVTAFRCGIDYASYTIATVDGDNKRAIYCNGTTWDRGNLADNAHTDSGYDWVIEEVSWLPVGVSTAAGFGTLYSPVALGQTNGVDTRRIQAYTGAVADGVLKLTPIEGTIPQNTPVIFQYLTGEENGKVFLQVMGDVADADYANNGTEGYLAGQFVTTAKGANASIYTLQNGSKGIGIYKYSGANIQGFRAYLPYTAPAGANALRIVFDDVTTGIEGIEVNDGGKTAIYDLSGRRVSRMTKGLYIVNGKKVFIK
ncbi:discoidin domain-containing protein [Prevotellamassilia timonensis]|uniref:discoidin domain-containing protein n=1 Tax=Prevotellamassilia timonensis TaxID=1852370 RepID=UPI001F2AD5CD|nr:discoidin domain-containing protein [Prevotellamassilia timonensis]MCF2634242.1 discoidin domain-containing protein [Prevotellamassilia timonensis]